MIIRTTRLTLAGVLVGGALLVQAAPAGAASAPAPAPADESAACAWKIVKTPPVGTSTLVGLKAFAPDDVWAVGSTGSFRSVGTLGEHWNGKRWSVVPLPNPIAGDEGNALEAIDGTSPSDIWAVGVHLINPSLDARPLILHFDGRDWKVVPNPVGVLDESALNDVVAIAPDDVWAVGVRFAGGPSEQDPLVIHWNGKTWRIVKAPNPPGPEADTLDAVTALGPDDVWATGQAGERTTLTIHFDGTKWRTVKSPNAPGTSRNELRDVVALAPNDLMAVGNGGIPTQSLAEHWDGTSWTIVQTQHKAQFDQLFGVAATGHGDELWAVGINQTPARTTQTFAEHFVDGAWTLSVTPSPSHGDHLDDVTVIGGDVWAVGATAPSLGAPGTALVLHRC